MPEAGTSFTRSRAVRVASGLASFGVVVGFSLVAASPASAATDADCTPLNTVDATTGTSTDIQTLLTASTPVICLSGTFTLTAGLTYDYDVTLHGLPSATLDGDGSYGILTDTGTHTLIVENLRFTNGNAFDGGAINGYGVLVNNSSFDNNSATSFGGAIAAYGTEINNSVFEDNTAAFGGAVAAGFVGVSASTFTQNSADASGGAIYGYGGGIGAVAVDSSTFEANTAQFVGGAIASYGSLAVDNSTFVGNSTEDEFGQGGAIGAESGTVFQSTFLDNSSGSGSAASIYKSSDTELTLRGNIFAGSVDEHLFADGTGQFADAGGNLFTTSEATESSLSGVQPSTLFDLTTLAIFNGATLADNGGPTFTVALYAGSPAINAVPADADSLPVDQRGVARPDVSDAGAYEFVAPVLAATGSVPSGILGGAAALLLGAGALAVGLARRAVRSR
ncbi:MAG TPA: choice-of-anchor Q domain-containing protein [Rhodoglobus sp.]|nr:choice-of-anchor Q domain-containing protein [Rhodoglobus sp.]HQG70396.1 choice-of-anchor Q domain-containing protein [Rhodoglobus sp.]HQI66201.1 choice-of-anchor Q domain-containing protein [Rhodoglobus sp.]HQJ35603.1 choice-of-anchor Q domain-containing protein [Rhodoglobus sp.]